MKLNKQYLNLRIENFTHLYHITFQGVQNSITASPFKKINSLGVFFNLFALLTICLLRHRK